MTADLAQLEAQLETLREARRNLNAQLDGMREEAPGYKALHLQRSLVNARYSTVTSALAAAHDAARLAAKQARREAKSHRTA